MYQFQMNIFHNLLCQFYNSRYILSYYKNKDFSVDSHAGTCTGGGVEAVASTLLALASTLLGSDILMVLGMFVML